VSTNSGIIRFSTVAISEDAAVEDILRQAPDDGSFMVLFCSPRYSLNRVGAALHRAGRRHVIGAQAGRVIGPQGVLVDGIAGFVLPSSRFVVGHRLIEDLAGFGPPDAREVVRSVRRRLELSGTTLPYIFGMLLVDAEARCEERLIASLGIELADVPIAGGSSGDVYFNPKGHEPRSPRILYEGRALRNAAIFCLIATDSPVRALSHNHYIPGRRKVVITDADPARRIVREIDGRSALHAYAEACGLNGGTYSVGDFSPFPLMIRIGGQYFARGIQRVHDDGSLEFACAMEPGMVLTVAKSGDITERLRDMFASLTTEIGAPELIIGFECAARFAYMEQKGLTAAVSDLLSDNSVVGFATLGEQYNTIHANNSFTCLYLPAAKDE